MRILKALRRTAILLVVLAVMTACGSSSDDEAKPTTTAAVTPSEASDDVAEEPVGPREQAESCEWDAEIVGGAAKATSEQSGDLKTLIIGSWQHTHFDTGSGYESLDSKDIRYVFPSADRLLYCQHVPGVTDHAENAANITWNKNSFAPPGGSAGWEVLSWNDDSMVWNNKLDGSKYLLKRR